MSSNNDKLLQNKLKKILDELLKENDNKYCADCKTKCKRRKTKKLAPRWASSTLGVFICIRCSGLHRKLGVHISFVRSVNLDSWQPKEVRMMQKWGNKRANMYWESKLKDDSIRPTEQSTMEEAERFIRLKYEDQKWVDANFDVKQLEEVPTPILTPREEEKEIKEVKEIKEGRSKSIESLKDDIKMNENVIPENFWSSEAEEVVKKEEIDIMNMDFSEVKPELLKTTEIDDLFNNIGSK